MQEVDPGFARHAVPGVELVGGSRYSRTMEIDGHAGILHAEAIGHEIRVEISTTLVPVLMPLLARIRRMFDLDAEPAVVATHLSAGGLAEQVAARPGLRLPGAGSGFEVALQELLGPTRLGKVIRALGTPVGTGVLGLTHLVPAPGAVLRAGADELGTLGVSRRQAEALCSIAELIRSGELRLEPGTEPLVAHRTLMSIPGMTDWLAISIVTRALYWPDSFQPADVQLQRAAGVAGARALLARAAAWRPWRAYAALLLEPEVPVISGA
jgi:AraC family transcriptional regulator of adaptative response / DNA-3-methyladenine glycosylase II